MGIIYLYSRITLFPRVRVAASSRSRAHAHAISRTRAERTGRNTGWRALFLPPGAVAFYRANLIAAEIALAENRGAVKQTCVIYAAMQRRE